MLEAYKDKQQLFYEEIINCINNDKITHAYLIETNNYEEKNELIISFIKTLFCKEHYISNDGYCDCNICKQIDNNTFADFIIVEPDGLWIKKEQILDIKEKFKTTSFQNGPRIYWIREADKLNKQAGNSLLKFLEEPDGNVIAILDVNNRYNVMETIRSRCQLYSLKNSALSKEFDNIELLCKIIKILEEKKEQSIAYLPIELKKMYNDRDTWKMLFNDMIYVYENAIRKKESIDYCACGEVLNLIISKNDTMQIIHKINTLFETINNMSYNLNINMMLDCFVINFSGGENNE